MLHILNGNGSARVFRESTLTGECLVWREALALGPTPCKTTGNDWNEVRAAHLAKTYEQDIARCRNTLLHQEQGLQEFTQHDETVLWFEFDLFCQVNLIYLLNWFNSQNLAGHRLSLVCIDKFPNVKNFRGLGQLEPEQLATLFNKRKPLRPAVLNLAADAWQAYTSPDPTQIEALSRKDTSGLPFLREAFLVHLARFPSLLNGLGRIEKVLLNLIIGGIDEFKPLFHMFLELQPEYGFGDWQIWTHLKNLSSVSNPLITIHKVEKPSRPLTSGDFMQAYFKMTDTGKAILTGNSDMLNRNDIDVWLGGVHLSGHNPLWRWNEANERLVQDNR